MIVMLMRVCVRVCEAPLFDGLMESTRAGVHHIQLNPPPLDQCASYTRIYVRLRASACLYIYIYVCVCVCMRIMYIAHTIYRYV